MKTFLANLLWIIRGSAELLGWATVVALAIFAFAPSGRTPVGAAPIEVSPVASRIAAKFSPQLQTLAKDHKDEAIDSVSGVLQRWCVGKVWDPAVAAIPRGVEIGSEAALNYFLDVPPREFASDLIEHAKFTGRRVDYRIYAAAEQRWEPR